MPQWIRYDNSRQVWEVSPNESESVFSDLKENFPIDTRFDRWIDFNAYEDSRGTISYGDSKSNSDQRRYVKHEGLWVPRKYDEITPKRNSRRKTATVETWESFHQVTTPPVSLSAQARLFFNKSTNRLQLSENAGTFVNLARENRSVLTQNSLTGGGDLSADRTINLVNDVTSPGHSYFYGTDGAGTKNWIKLDGCRVLKTADQVISTSSLTAINFDSEASGSGGYDTNSLHDTVTNNTRITIPTTGIWLIGCAVLWAANATGVRQLILRADGSIYLEGDTRNATATGDCEQIVITVRRLSATQYVETVVSQTSGGNLNITASNERSPYFWAQLLRTDI